MFLFFALGYLLRVRAIWARVRRMPPLSVRVLSLLEYTLAWSPPVRGLSNFRTAGAQNLGGLAL